MSDVKKSYKVFGTNHPGEVPQDILSRRQEQIDGHGINISDAAKKAGALFGIGTVLTAAAVGAQKLDKAPSGAGNVIPIENTAPGPNNNSHSGFTNSGLGKDGKVHLYYDSGAKSPNLAQSSSPDITPGSQAPNGNILVENGQGGYSVETPQQNPQAQALENLKKTGTLPTDHQ